MKMNANEMIDTIIAKHENEDSSPIQVCDNLHLEPMLNYSGKMARKAYQGYRKNWHTERKHIGILDFRIAGSNWKNGTFQITR